MVVEISQFWMHNWSPFLIRFPENPLGLDGIRFYGLAYLLGFIFTWYFLNTCEKKGKISLNASERSDLMTYVILGILIGGRTGYMLFYDINDFISNPLSIIRIDQGGMSSHGGIIGIFLSVLLYSKIGKRNASFLKLSDALTVIAPLGIILGRFANFINGELWGKISTVPWAILFPNSPLIYSDYTGYFGIQPRHPSQLYAMGTEGLIPLIYLQYRFWFTRYTTGQLFGEFLVLYSTLRILNEFFREPDASLILGLSRGQFYSIFILCFGIIYILKIRTKLTSESHQAR